jgi:pimeloyl-ACP methyl ester carboxylesterase
MNKLLVALILAAGVTPAQEVTGDWLGVLEGRSIKVRIGVHINKDAAGALQGTMDSLDQGAMGIGISSVSFKEGVLKFAVDMAHVQYEGTLKPDGSIEGTWNQGAPLRLVLKRSSVAEMQLPRPQNPVKPYPYREEEVTYQNKTAGIKLAGTLTIPQGKGPFTTVLLITGSGAQDRDESLMGHKPFLVLSDYLTRRGIEVLRVDDRGVGGSGGNFATSTTADFATDTEAGVEFLKTRPEVNHRKIGLIGHSEGGAIAPMVAARHRDVAFIVMMAGVGVPGTDLIVEQVRALALASGMPREKADEAASKQRQIVTAVRDEKDMDTLKSKLRDLLAKDLPADQVGPAIGQLTSPWYRYLMAFDPAPVLTKVKCPVLAINGEKDLQVPPKINLPAIRKGLEAAGNKNFEVVELPGLNHLFQTAKTGLVIEYAQIEETISPVALEKMGVWIGKR